MNALSVLPVFLRLRGRKAVLAGSGDAAAWKAELLAAAGAEALVLSPDPSPKLAETIARLGLATESRAWRESDLEGALIAVIEAPDEAEAERFRLAARRAGALVNAVDRPAFCDFSFGSIVERSPLVIGISTDGAAPVFAQAVRSRIEAMFPESLREWAKAAREWRERFAGFDLRRRRAIWTAFSARAFASLDRGPSEADYGALDSGERAGRLVLVGVGPGPLDLLTLRAVRVLQSADLVVEDGAVDPGVRGLGRREADVEIFRGGVDPAARRRALARVGEGATVVVLRPGDDRTAGWEEEAKRTGVVCEIALGVNTP